MARHLLVPNPRAKVAPLVHLDYDEGCAKVAHQVNTKRQVANKNVKVVKLEMHLRVQPRRVTVVRSGNLEKPLVFASLARKTNIKTPKDNKNARAAKKVKHLQRQQHPVLVPVKLGQFPLTMD